MLERHTALSEEERWLLVQQPNYVPIEAGPVTDENGVRRKGAWLDGIRRRVSGFYFEDRVEPVTPAELAAAQHHGEHDSLEAGGEVPLSVDGADTERREIREVGSGQA